MRRGQFSIFGAVEENVIPEIHGFSARAVHAGGVCEAHGNAVFHFGSDGMGEIGAKGGRNIHRGGTGNAETPEGRTGAGRGLILSSDLRRGNYRIYPSAVPGGKLYHSITLSKGARSCTNKGGCSFFTFLADV